jgi:hypothetical protein
MSGGAPDPITLRFEMGCVAEEFHRRLPAVAAVTFDAALNQFTHQDGGRRWTLRLVDQRERRIANIRLPVTDAVFVFEGYVQPEVDAVMERFFAHFRRGGG